MNVSSYVAIPLPGRLEELVQDLRSLGSCEVISASSGHEVAIVLVETPDREAQEALMKRFSDLPSLQSMTLTFGSVPESAAKDDEAQR